VYVCLVTFVVFHVVFHVIVLVVIVVVVVVVVVFNSIWLKQNELQNLARRKQSQVAFTKVFNFKFGYAILQDSIQSRF